MQLDIHTFQVRQRNLLLENHLVEADDEVGIQESTMEDTQTQAPTDELEIVQMLGIDTRRRVDLKGVVVVSGILKEAVEGVEHLMRKQEEEFSVTIVMNLWMNDIVVNTDLDRPP